MLRKEFLKRTLNSYETALQEAQENQSEKQVTSPDSSQYCAQCCAQKAPSSSIQNPITQKIKHDDKHKRLTFAASVLDKIDENNSYFDHICFSDESIFQISEKVNRLNCRIWGSENPSVVFQHECDSPKVNVWCGLMKNRVIGPFFFAEPTATARTYLDMLELYVVPQLPAGTIYQQDGAPPHYALEVRKFLNDNFPGQWIGRGSETIAWPPRSPDLTPLDFFLWGFVKDQVYSIPDEIDIEQASQTLFLLTKEHTKLSVEQYTWLFLQNY